MRARIISTLLIFTVLMGISCPGSAAEATSREGYGDVSGKIVNEVLFEIHDYPGRSNRIMSMARDLIPLKQGHPYSEEAVNQSVSVLKLSGMFEEASVLTGENSEGVSVTFRIRPFLQIRDIEISGEYPLFERDILNVMTVHAGSFLRVDTCSDQAEQIRQYLVSEGFPDARVNVEAELEGEEGTTALLVDIHKGGISRLSSLEITGRESFSELRIKSRMKTWEASFLPWDSGRFIEKVFDRDIRNLSSFYISKGYPESSITSSLNRIPGTHDVQAGVVVEEGPCTRVGFRGNTAFYDFTLKNQVTIFREGNRNRSGERKSVRNIRELYQKSGYPDVKVKVEESPGAPEGKPERNITFVIDEGPRTVISAVAFRGSTVFRDEELLEHMQSWKRIFPLVG
ncbi:hypothetical protein EG833_00800, partial [archaeon]|nr:hypothetical protein [archaeon]